MSRAAASGRKRRANTTALIPTDTETSSLKRQLARALAQVEEYKHVAERTKLEASIAAEKSQAQLDESASRIDKLERQRAVLLAKEREDSERANRKKEDEDGEKTKLEKTARELRAQLVQLQDEHADLQASFADLEHSASQAVAQANSHRQRTAGLQDEIDHLRSEVEHQRQSAAQEHTRRIAVETELEQEKMKARSGGDSAIIRDELHREFPRRSLLLELCTLTSLRRAGQVTTLRTLEKDNAKLQRRVETYEQQHANAELLKETNRSLEKKLKQAELLRQQVAAQSVELEILKREKADW